MVFVIRDVLSSEEVASVLAPLGRARWVDGRVTALGAAAEAKSNEQLDEGDPLRAELASLVLSSLARCAAFGEAARPLRMYPPGFNRYRPGQGYGPHVDNVLRAEPGNGPLVRGDLSATLFLSAPEDYEGGELVVRSASACHEAKLPAGSLFLYPSTTVHEVRPVTRGERLACFFWVQSVIRDHEERRILFELDELAGRALAAMPDDTMGLRLLALHNELLQRWSQA